MRQCMMMSPPCLYGEGCARFVFHRVRIFNTFMMLNGYEVAYRFIYKKS